MDDIDADYFIGTYPKISDNRFTEKIWKRKEFHDQNIEKNSKLKGHQRRLQRYASPVTPYDEVLLFHEMGTGKTRSALAIAENALDSGRGINKVVIVGPNSGIVKKVFTTELSKMKEISMEEATMYMKKNYMFSTYQTLSSEILNNSEVDFLKKKWNNTVFILDEVHNLTRNKWKPNIKNYDFVRFKYLFKHEITPNRKIVLLSGTPMVDDAKDIYPLMELIIPLTVKFTGNESEKLATLAQYGKSRVSYLKSDIRSGAVPAVKVEGEIKVPMQKLKLVYLKMSDFQTDAYNQVLKMNKESLKKTPGGDAADEGSGGDAFLKAQRNVALFAFPKKNGKLLTDEKDWCKGKNFSKEFWEELSTNKLIDINKVKKYSCKFADVLRKLKDGPWPIYVYSTPTGDSQGDCPGPGLNLLKLILVKLGYGEFKKKSKQKNFLYFTSSSVPSANTIKEFNKKNNQDGNQCRIILGSKASSEGYTFRNLKNEIILTPHWNYAVIDQALARGVRVNSHDDPNGEVKISRLVAVPNGKSGMDIIDVKLYSVSEQKDIKIKKVEHILKENSFDCPYNYMQNARQGENSRDCDYGECYYTCKGIQGTPTNEDGYPEPNLYTKTWEKYYAPKDKIISKIKTIFKTSSSVDFEVLEDKLKDIVGKMGLLEVLSDLLVNRTVIRKDKERNCYLSNYKNKINLTLDLIEPAGKAVIIAPYYIDNPVLLPVRSLSKVELERNRDRNKLAEYLSDPVKFFEKPDPICEECANISTLPMEIQEKLLEAAYSSDNKTAPKINQYFSAAIFKVNNRTVSALKFTFGQGNLRVFENEEWVDADDNLTMAYMNRYEGKTVNDEIVDLILERNPKLLDGSVKLAESEDTIDSLRNLSIENLRIETNKEEFKRNKNKKKFLDLNFELDLVQFSAKKLSIGMNATSLKKYQLAAIFIYLKINFDEKDKIDITDLMKDNDYFPWIGKSAQPEYPIKNQKVSSSDLKKAKDIIQKNSKLKVDDNKLKNLLSFNIATSIAILYKKLKKMDRLFLDVNCGTANKDRKNAKIMKKLDGQVYGLFNYKNCTLCIKGPDWLTTVQKK